MLHSQCISQREQISLFWFEAAAVEALQATNLVVDTRSNSKPSRFHDHSLLKSMKYQREIVADIFIHQARCGLPTTALGPESGELRVMAGHLRNDMRSNGSWTKNLGRIDTW